MSYAKIILAADNGLLYAPPLMHTPRTSLLLFLKGMAMGAANVVPGVSGGTLALITGIFEPLILSIRSADLHALRLLCSGQFKALAQHVNLSFLLCVFAGIGAAILSLARIFDFLFTHYPDLIWSYFLGLVLASVYFVGRKITRWSWPCACTLTLGTAMALALTFLTPASENANPLYLFVCGVVAMCSMILPGLSGSFVLILMGNYQLIMIDAVKNLRLEILIPVALGAGIGLMAFARFLAWLLKRFFDPTLALLTGFILGSLGVLWPWKNKVIQLFGTKEKVVGYEWLLPPADTALILPVLLMLAGVATLWITETLAVRTHANTDAAPSSI